MLLIFDGHHSHLTDEFIDLGTEYGIDFYLLPSHTTHKLQPLDVGCFGPMQREWLTRCETLVESGTEVEHGRFVAEYLQVRDASITPDVVKAAWRKTGLFPFNPNVFSEHDFAPSRSYSTQAHLPPSFPIAPALLQATASSTTLLGSTAPPIEMPSDADSLAPPASASTSALSEGLPMDMDDIQATTRNSSTTRTSTDMSHPRSRSPSPMDIDEPPSPTLCTSAPASLTSVDATLSVLSTFLPLLGPHFPEFRQMPISQQTCAVDKVEVLTKDLQRLQELYTAEFQRRLTAESHCAHAAKAIVGLKGRLAQKETKKRGKEKTFKSRAKFLMGKGAMEEHQKRKHPLDDAERELRDNASQPPGDIPVIEDHGAKRSRSEN